MSTQMFYRIKQLRSTIGMPPVVRENIKALGLKRINQVVYQRVSVSTAHKLRKVKELVSIDLMDESHIEALKLNDKPKFPTGFSKIGEM